jgi:purine-binding chemotaxis protein CheW
VKKMSNMTQDDDRFLLFWVGSELFATPLMGVREVVELQKIKPIPHTVKSYLGVINIRGEIVGAIDLRTRFGFSALESRFGAMMVFETTSGSIAAVTDRLDGVVKIDASNIDSKPRIEAKIPVNFLLGIGKVNDRLVTIIDLGKVLDAEEVATVGKSTTEIQAAS